MPKYKPYTQRNFEKSIKGMGKELDIGLEKLKAIYAAQSIPVETEVDIKKLKDQLVMAYEVSIAPVQFPSAKLHITWRDRQFSFTYPEKAKDNPAFVPPPNALTETVESYSPEI